MDTEQAFHPGEIHFQKQSGVQDIACKLASSMVMSYLPEQHQDFYPLLTTLFVASVDEAGAPWASILTGQTGFVYAVNSRNLRINATPIPGDPLNNNFNANPYLGILGLAFDTRRRNRLAGKLINRDSSGINIQVQQALGNCPKYIQARHAVISDHFERASEKKEIIKISQLSEELRQFIITADTFFIASYYPESGQKGADISHRGGKPGFISIDNDKRISFDDYSGNNLFMTLGNLHSNPQAGLLFIDFESGDTLQLSCKAEIVEMQGNTLEKKIKRQVKLSLDYGYLIKSALDIKWKFIDYSRFL